MPIIPENDPNEAYDVVPMPITEHGPKDGWWSVLCNGVPVYHFAPNRRDLADQYATDPAYRLGRITKKLHEK